MNEWVKVLVTYEDSMLSEVKVITPCQCKRLNKGVKDTLKWTMCHACWIRECGTDMQDSLEDIAKEWGSINLQVKYIDTSYESMDHGMVYDGEFEHKPLVENKEK